MSKKTTLNDILLINKILSEKKYNSFEEFLSYLDVIQNYIDETFIKQDIITERLAQYCEKSGRYLKINFNKTSDIELHTEIINNYFKITKEAVERTIFTEEVVFDHFIFVEIKSIFKYITEKSYSCFALKDFEILYSINTVEFHQQNESFKYLYTIFDKLTYVARHLNDKYLKKEGEAQNREILKFGIDFLRDISFLAINAKTFQQLSDVMDQLCMSNTWHFLRKLRNLIEHDFVDPTNKYNITFAFQLLYIIIGRIILALNKYLQTNDQIKNTIENLRQN